MTVNSNDRQLKETVIEYSNAFYGAVNILIDYEYIRNIAENYKKGNIGETEAFGKILNVIDGTYWEKKKCQKYI